MSTKKKQILAMKAVPYSLINGFLYKMGLDDILRRCVLEHERDKIMDLQEDISKQKQL